MTKHLRIAAQMFCVLLAVLHLALALVVLGTGVLLGDRSARSHTRDALRVVSDRIVRPFLEGWRS